LGLKGIANKKENYICKPVSHDCNNGEKINANNENTLAAIAV
jgi:hypothetical protein